MVEYTKEEIRSHRKKYPIPKWCRGKRKSDSFIRSDEWKKLRAIVLECYGNVCMCCGSTEQINVDHIKPRKHYPELALNFDNLQVLCWPCNRRKNFIDATDYRKLPIYG